MRTLRNNAPFPIDGATSDQVSLPTLTLSSAIEEEIRCCAIEAFRGRNGRGLEIGGVLVARAGFQSKGEIWIEGTATVPCEYRYGPSFDLSPSDLRVLAAKASEIRRSGKAIAGYFRSCLDEPFAYATYDAAILREYLPEAGFLLIVKPQSDSRIVVRVYRPEDSDWALRSEFEVLPPGGVQSLRPVAVARPIPLPVKTAPPVIVTDAPPYPVDPYLPPPGARKALATRQIRRASIGAALLIVSAMGLGTWLYTRQESGDSRQEPVIANAMPPETAAPTHSLAPAERPLPRPQATETVPAPLRSTSLDRLLPPEKTPAGSVKVQSKRFLAPPRIQAAPGRTKGALIASLPPSIEGGPAQNIPAIPNLGFSPAAPVPPVARPSIAPSPVARPSIAPVERRPVEHPVENASDFQPPQILQQFFPNTKPIGSSVVFGPTDISVKVQIDATGRVTSAELANPVAKPHQLLASQALSAARKWTFEPARRGGIKEPGTHVIVFRFR